MARKHISWKTKCASALLCMLSERDLTWYNDAKKMTKDQFLSLFHFDHNILHETGHEDRDEFWNLIPKFIREHREKTKQDAKIIAKSRRIRDAAGDGNHVARLTQAGLRTGLDGECQKAEGVSAVAIRPARTLRSRGFDKTKTKGFDGKVRERKRR